MDELFHALGASGVVAFVGRIEARRMRVPVYAAGRRAR